MITNCIASFAVTIENIFGASPDEKMGRVDARWGIALVANAKAFGYVAVNKNPRESVGGPMFTAVLYVPVPILVAGTGPEPTTCVWLCEGSVQKLIDMRVDSGGTRLAFA